MRPSTTKPLKNQILALHAEHPMMTSPQIADRVGCCDAYVAHVLRRHGQVLAGNPSVRQLGMAAKAEGLTLHDIRMFHRIKAMASKAEVA